jgi:hypothetical protein
VSTARDFLAAVQQRADQPVGWPAMSFEKAVALGDALKDRRRLVAALTAALDLHHADSDGDCIACGVDVYEEPIPWPCPTVRAITDALTPKENDS